MSGSFWKFSNGFTSLSNVLKLLEQYNSSKNDIDSEPEEQLLKLKAGEEDENSVESVLSRLLDESDLLQELLSNNSMLLEFLRDEKVLELLVGLVVNEASETKKDEAPEGESKDVVLAPDAEENNKDQKDAVLDEKNAAGDDADAGEAAEANIEELDEKTALKQQQEDDDNDDDEEVTDEKEATKEKEEIDEKETDEEDTRDDDKLETSGNYDEDEDTESEDERKTRHATLAAEILAADVWSLTDTVMESTNSLDTLWSILDNTNPLSINLSTYFMKIMEHLLDMKCDEMITYLIDNQPSLVTKFMNHLSNPPLMDFLLKLISTDKPDNSTGIIDFLQNQGLIEHLIQALEIVKGASDDNEGDALLRQSSAADFLKALITISANSTSDTSSIGPNELTRELVSYKQMLNLCDIMLKGDYALANGVGIIIEIIRKNNSDYDLLPVLYITLESHPPTGRDPIYLGHLLKVFGDKIEDFNQLLLKAHDEKDGKLRTPFGEIEPLGFERFKICELIAELLHCSNMALLNDNKGFDIVKERDDLRAKMKEYDPISFKYNEVIVLPSGFESGKQTDSDADKIESTTAGSGDGDSDVAYDLNRLRMNELEHERDLDNFGNDTVDSFNEDGDDDEEGERSTEGGILDDEESFQNEMHGDGDTQEGEGEDEGEEETHANANLTEAQIRASPVIGDFLKISLYDTQIISNILSMFFKFPWNNFLHNVVFDIVQQVLNGSMDIGFNKFLSMDLFDRGDITNRIVNGQKECTEYEEGNNGLRLGYMGHLTLIAEEVVKFIQLYPANTLSELIDIKVEDKVWEEYVSNVLYDTREKYNAILGGGDDDEDDEDEDEEASNTFDEGVGEILEDEEKDLGLANGLLLDSSIDHDMLSAAYHEDYSEHEEDVVKKNNQPQVSSDESESEEDDDHFSNYMSLQLSNTNHSEAKLPSPTTKMSDDEDDDDESSEEEESEYIRGNVSPNHEVVVGGGDDDDDEYIDPNDDGLSYKKSAHPLYDSKGALISMGTDDVDEEELSEDSSSPSSDEDDDDDDDEDIDASKKASSKDGNKLTRAASKS